MASVWSDCLRDLYIHHKHKPRNWYTNSNDRPDIVVFDAATGSRVELNVKLAHPWSPDTFPRSANVDGAAAWNREGKKNKYKVETRSRGASVDDSVPLVFEHFRRWGKGRLVTFKSWPKVFWWGGKTKHNWIYWLLEEKVCHPFAERQQQCLGSKGDNWPVLLCPILQALN